MCQDIIILKGSALGGKKYKYKRLGMKRNMRNRAVYTGLSMKNNHTINPTFGGWGWGLIWPSPWGLTQLLN